MQHLSFLKAMMDEMDKYSQMKIHYFVMDNAVYDIGTLYYKLLLIKEKNSHLLIQRFFQYFFLVGSLLTLRLINVDAASCSSRCSCAAAIVCNM